MRPFRNELYFVHRLAMAGNIDPLCGSQEIKLANKKYIIPEVHPPLHEVSYSRIYAYIAFVKIRGGFSRRLSGQNMHRASLTGQKSPEVTEHGLG